jgi:phage-related protein
VQSFNINDGDVTITADGTYTITGTGRRTSNRIVVESGVTADITLNGVNISTDNCAFDMTGATVVLTLVGNNTLTSGGHYPGLQAPAS